MKLLWVLFVSVLGFTAVAQSVPKCEDSFKVFEGKFLSKEYNDAYKLLPNLRKRCPKVDENLYVYGEGILKYLIEVATLPEEKKPFVEDLVALYNEQSMNYPASSATVKKTQLQLDYKLINNAEAYKAFDAAFAKNKLAFTDYNAILSYYNLFFEAYKAGKGISDDQYFDKYGEITSQVLNAQVQITKEKELLVTKQEKSTLSDAEKQFIIDAEPNVEGLENVNEIIFTQSKDYVSCDKMNAYYDKNYEAHKENYVWVESMVNALYAKKCYKSLVLQKGALTLDGLKPTSLSSFRLGMIALKKGDSKSGITYFEKAAELEKDSAKKVKIYSEITNIAQNSDKAIAKKYLLKTIELNPKKVEVYLVLADLYANVSSKSDCNLTDFDRKVLNFLAIDTVKKAAADPKYKTAVDEAVKRYSKNLPKKDEAKVLGKRKGDVVSFGCWINEKVTLPNL
ncbi:tetratricopeptide repeat protein [Flavobacterium hauense]